VSDHEDVLRQTLRFYREHAPANCKEANAIDAVLAEVALLRKWKEQYADAYASNEAEAESLRHEVLVRDETIMAQHKQLESLRGEHGKARDTAISLAAKLAEAQRIINDQQERGNEMLARAERAEQRVAYRDRHVVLALTRERDTLSCSLSNVEDELKRAGMGCVGPPYLRVSKLRRERDAKVEECREQSERAAHFMAQADRLREALWRLMVVDDVLQGFDAYAQIKSGNGGGMGANILIEQQGRFFSRSYWERVRRALAEAREALAPSAPEPERQVTRRCRHCGEPNGWQDGDILTLEAHADCIAKAHTPAPAPTERVCRCEHGRRWKNTPCNTIHDPASLGICMDCGHDRACHTGEQR
jgi:hypothetical protein